MTLWAILSTKSFKVYQIRYFVLVFSKDAGAILCQMLSICKEIYTPYFVAIIKRFLYFLNYGNKFVDARFICLKTELIKSDQVIFDEKLKHSVM